MISHQQVERSDPFSLLALSMCVWSTGSGAGLPSVGETWAYCKSSRATKAIKGLERLCYGEKLREPGVEKAQGAFIHVDTHLVGEVKKA